MLNLDPIKSTEILAPLGLFPHDFDNPQKFSKIQEIVSYFGTYPNPRSKVLQVLLGKPGEKLDILWEYVALQNEKKAKVATLNPNDFEPDIAEELSKQHLSLKTSKRIKEDIARRKLEAQRKQEHKQEQKDQRGIDKALDLTHVEKTIDDIEDLNKLIAVYE
jgi:hypothetical protein